MDICPKCGMTLRPGAFVCPRCGAPVSSDAPAAGPVPSPSGRPLYLADPAPAAGALTTGGYLLCLFLFNLPIAGIIIALVFAFSGTQDPARRNLARAQLLFWWYCLGAFLVVYLIVLAVISHLMRSGAMPNFFF